MQFIVFALLVIGVVDKCYGLKCYICGFSSSDTDRSCLTISAGTLAVDCPYQYCTIMRQELLDPPGQIASFIRNCEPSPIFLNHEVEDSMYRSFYRACTSDLCNIGDGIQSVTGGGMSPSPEYEGPNLLVPGTGSGAERIHFNFVLFMVVVTLRFYLSNNNT